MFILLLLSASIIFGIELDQFNGDYHYISGESHIVRVRSNINEVYISVVIEEYGQEFGKIVFECSEENNSFIVCKKTSIDTQTCQDQTLYLSKRGSRVYLKDHCLNERSSLEKIL